MEDASQQENTFFYFLVAPHRFTPAFTPSFRKRALCIGHRDWLICYEWCRRYLGLVATAEDKVLEPSPRTDFVPVVTRYLRYRQNDKLE